MKTLQELKEYLQKRKAHNQQSQERNRIRETNRADTKPWTLKGIETDGWYRGRIDLIESVLKWLDEATK